MRDDNASRDDEDVDVKVITKTKKGWSRFKITIEPIKLLIGFTIAFTSGVTIDLIERNACIQYFNRSLIECSSNLPLDIKTKVEVMTADVNMINNILQGIFPLFLVLLIGPWSDTNGRKPFIKWALWGYIIYYLLWLMFSFFSTIPLLVFLIPALPLGLSGGLIGIFVCTWSYVCDNFEDEERPLRFSVCGSCTVAGSIAGNTLAGQVMKVGGHYGFQIVFFISLLTAIFTLVYTIFFVEETVKKPKEERTNLWNLENVKSVFVVVLLKPQKGALLSFLVLSALIMEIPIYAGDDGIVYLVGKSQFSWSLAEYTMFAAFSNLVSALTPVLLIWFFINLLGMKNMTCLLMSAIWLFVMEILKTVSVDETMFWVTGLLTKTASLVGPTLDTELSHIVSEDNLGKAFTFMSLIDALSPVVAIPTYTELYKYLLPDRTLNVFFLSIAMASIVLTSSIGLNIWKSNYSKPLEDPPLENDDAQC